MESRFRPRHPEIRVELSIDYGLSEIVSGRYDACVRRGGLVAKDMIAVQVSPPLPMAVVAARAYLAKRAESLRFYP